jgi:serine/threonine protein kinase/Tfp pilus assembly protein PilF
MAPERPDGVSTETEDGGEKQPAPSLKRGTNIGRYVLVDRVGEGGMGVVYRAYDPELDRTVAIKLLQGGDGESHQHRDRLLREAQALARLQHPNVIAVYDAGTFGNDVFIAMEFVEGKTLRQWQAAEPRTHKETLAMYLAAGEGLAAAHRAELVHRDFKPDNVIVGADGRVRVLDFGLARRADTPRPGDEKVPTAEVARVIDPAPPQGEPTLEARRTPRTGSVRTVTADIPATPSPTPSDRLAMPVTRAGAIVGTPRYMAPEQHKGQATDASADQFSFCVCLYRALYEVFPFAGDSEPEYLAHVEKGEISEPPAGATVPRWLRQVLVRGLATRPADRHPSMEALLAALRADPRAARNRRLRAALLVSVPLLALAGWRVAHWREARLCAGGPQKLAGVWDAPRRESVRQAFGKSGLSYADKAVGTVVDALDRYAQAWGSMYTDACEATQVRHEQSQELLDLRMSCLGNRLTQLRTLSDVFASADAQVVVHSVESVQSLPRLEGCADAAALRAPVAPPADPKTRAKVEDVRQQLARLHALQMARPSPEVVTIARQALAEAQALHYAPVEAEAEMRLGEVLEDRGEFAEAAKALHRAWVAGLSGHHDTVSAWVATDLVRALGVSQGKYEEGDRWADTAEALIKRLEHQGNVLGALYANRSELRKEESRYPDAVKDGKRGVELLSAELGPDHQAVAEIWNTLGNIYRDQQQFPEALDAYRHALAIWMRLGGPDHPKSLASQNGVADVYGDSGQHDTALLEYQRVLTALLRVDPGSANVANIRNNMGTELMALGKPRQALEQYNLALVDWQKRVGPSTEVVTGLNNMGSASLALDQLDDAEKYFGDALAMSDKVLGPTNLYSGVVLQGLGETRLRHGKRDQAKADYKRSQGIIEKVLDPKNPRLVATFLGLGRVELDAHNPAGARAPLEQGLAIAQAQPEDGRELAQVKVALAEALWPADRKRSHDLAAQARDALSKLGPRAHRDLAEVTAWLAKHP